MTSVRRASILMSSARMLRGIVRHVQPTPATILQQTWQRRAASATLARRAPAADPIVRCAPRTGTKQVWGRQAVTSACQASIWISSARMLRGIVRCVQPIFLRLKGALRVTIANISRGMQGPAVESVKKCVGNVVKTPREECDDGNTACLDGCSANCIIECGFVCDVAVPQSCSLLVTKSATMATQTMVMAACVRVCVFVYVLASLQVCLNDRLQYRACKYECKSKSRRLKGVCRTL